MTPEWLTRNGLHATKGLGAVFFSDEKNAAGGMCHEIVDAVTLRHAILLFIYEICMRT